MMLVTNFDISENSFTQMLPESGIRAVTNFEVQVNRFTGSLPDGGMRAMRALEILATYENRLAGMLPAGIHVKAVSRLNIYDNFFVGTVGESLPCPYTRATLGEIVQYSKLCPPEIPWKCLSFPQDVASSVQSLKPRKLVGAWPQLL
eukprot:4172575-Amphidinium_carterae.1